MNIYKIMPIIAIISLCFTQALFAQEITEDNYLKIDKEIWGEYEQDMEKISECYKQFLEKDCC